MLKAILEKAGYLPYYMSGKLIVVITTEKSAPVVITECMADSVDCVMCMGELAIEHEFDTDHAHALSEISARFRTAEIKKLKTSGNYIIIFHEE